MNSLFQIFTQIMGVFRDSFLYAFSDVRNIPYQLLVVLCVFGLFRLVFSLFVKDDDK